MNCFQVVALKQTAGWTKSSREVPGTQAARFALPDLYCLHSDAGFGLKIFAGTTSQQRVNNSFSKLIVSYFRKIIHTTTYLYLSISDQKCQGIITFLSQTWFEWLNSKLSGWVFGFYFSCFQDFFFLWPVGLVDIWSFLIFIACFIGWHIYHHKEKRFWIAQDLLLMETCHTPLWLFWISLLHDAEGKTEQLPLSLSLDNLQSLCQPTALTNAGAVVVEFHPPQDG